VDRGPGPFVAGFIPEDDCVRQAAAANQATVIAFPDAPASRAFRALAEVIAAGES
jgi:MinD-like ATPase involved in chromosome partitioning or flagellar assembly